MKKILYMSHVNWSWIKQRPHYIAEGLSETFEVFFYGGMNYVSRNNAWEDTLTSVHINSYFRIPNKIKKISKFCQYIDYLIGKIQFQLIIFKLKPDLIWVTSPEISHYIPLRYFHKVIFDCMDDYVLLVSNEKLKNRILSNLKYLVGNCRLIFTSSLKLQHDISRMCTKDINLIGNAAPDIFRSNVLKDFDLHKSSDGCYWAVYIGTISEWFDFDSLIYLLNSVENLKIALYGPKDVDIPQHQNLVYFGIIKHSRIPVILNKFDFYLMPFKVTDLVLAVDPVKIYEYLNFNGIVIAINYPELEKFSDLILTYNNKYELVELFISLFNNEIKININSKILFNAKNTWNLRVQKICTLLNEN